MKASYTGTPIIYLNIIFLQTFMHQWRCLSLQSTTKQHFPRIKHGLMWAGQLFSFTKLKIRQAREAQRCEMYKNKVQLERIMNNLEEILILKLILNCFSLLKMKSPVIVDLLGTGLKTPQTKLLFCVNRLIRWHITSPQWRQKYDGREKVCHALRKLC